MGVATTEGSSTYSYHDPKKRRARRRLTSILPMQGPAIFGAPKSPRKLHKQRRAERVGMEHYGPSNVLATEGIQAPESSAFSRLLFIPARSRSAV
jgi:hypothetical protein